MDNKRGISQAFSNAPGGIVLRPATVFDAFDLSRVLIRSIVHLCEADHLNDPQNISLWTANKDPASVRDWIMSDSIVWLVENGGRVAAIGGAEYAGRVTLLYVDPAHTRRSLGAALLNRLEQELITAGCAVAHLEATRTACDFYLSQGWQLTGEDKSWNGIQQYRMRKSLHLRD